MSVVRCSSTTIGLTWKQPAHAAQGSTMLALRKGEEAEMDNQRDRQRAE
jgi:hypothetical protein